MLRPSSRNLPLKLSPTPSCQDLRGSIDVATVLAQRTRASGSMEGHTVPQWPSFGLSLGSPTLSEVPGAPSWTPGRATCSASSHAPTSISRWPSPIRNCGVRHRRPGADGGLAPDRARPSAEGRRILPGRARAPKGLTVAAGDAHVLCKLPYEVARSANLPDEARGPRTPK